jgi:DNA-binding CsgD family transcriptional regulator
MVSDGEFDDCFQTALTWHTRAPLHFERAWTELCYGERLRRARRRGDAREPLTHAADTFRSLGARLWLERTERELAAAGQRAEKLDSPAPWSQLTGAETRVARQIIEGATYEEAASALYVSPRTIEAHLRQMYRKLGVRSRAELTHLLMSHPVAIRT